MNIGILTVPFNNNYGGFLQAFALKRVLVGMGHSVIFINRSRPPETLKGLFWRFMDKIRGRKTVFFRERKIRWISRETNKFRQQYLAPETKSIGHCITENDLRKYQVDFVVVGSDQVWRYKYALRTITDFFLCSVDERVPRIAYAASFGVDYDEYPDEVRPLCLEGLKKFKNISVREKSALDILNSKFASDKVAELVLDPTFLLEKEEYEKLFSDYAEKKEKQCFVYILDKSPEIKGSVEKVCSAYGLKKVAFSAQTSSLYDDDILQPVEKWLQAIHDAEYVMTDSFHGMVFSIIFNKPFVVFVNKSRGAGRFFSLLQLFGLENRMMESLNKDVVSLFSQPIDWKHVNLVVQEKKLNSMQYLVSSLKT